MPTFLNSKKRTILQSERGKYFVQTANGKAYNPKAKYVIMGGSTVMVKNTQVNVPSPIRAKAVPRKPQAAAASGSPVRNKLAVNLQRYLNANTANKSILSTRHLANINQAAKLLKIVAGNGQGWRFQKISTGKYKNVSEGNSPARYMTRSNILQAIHNYGQGNSNLTVNKYVKEFRAPTPSHLWM